MASRALLHVILYCAIMQPLNTENNWIQNSFGATAFQWQLSILLEASMFQSSAFLPCIILTFSVSSSLQLWQELRDLDSVSQPIKTYHERSSFVCRPYIKDISFQPFPPPGCPGIPRCPCPVWAAPIHPFQAFLCTSDRTSSCKLSSMGWKDEV